MNAKYEVKDLGKAQSALGILVTHSDDGSITLAVPGKIRAALETAGLAECKGSHAPADPKTKLSKSMSPKTQHEIEEMNDIPYRRAVGQLLYITRAARPDIAHAVMAVSRFACNPGKPHWAAVKRILRYLASTIDRGITYRRTSSLQPVGFADSDWGNNTDDRRSITGYMFNMSGAPVAWKSRAQTTVALSSCEAEYMAAADCVKELMWLKNLMGDLKLGLQLPITQYSDNQGAIALAEKPGSQHQRTKHIDVRHHFIREKVEAGTVELKYMPTAKMPADALTKNLPPHTFKRVTALFMNDN